MIHIAPEFAAALTSLLQRVQPMTVLETGTNDGSGSTSVLWAALQDLRPDRGALPVLISMEVNPALVAKAKARFQGEPRVWIWEGLSLPGVWLPDKKQLAREMEEARAAGMHVDFTNPQDYLDESTAHGDDDLLLRFAKLVGSPSTAPEHWPIVAFLDSAGHLGTREAQRLMGLLPKAPMWVALDDVNHLKHYRTIPLLQAFGFKVEWQTKEKYGAAILCRP